MATIYDLITSTALTAYWETLSQDLPPYLGEELWPEQQKIGLKLDWIKGSKGLPVVLAPSQYDVRAKKRDHIGFEELSASMPFFKESVSVDEELRQQLNLIMQTGNQPLIDSVINRIYDDEMDLLTGARAQRERMRMMALTTGGISIVANGQVYDYNYQMPDDHKVTVGTSWSDPAADIYTDVETGLDKIEGDTGVRPSRAVCSQKTWGYMRKNTAIRNAILGNNSGVAVSDTQIHQYFMDNLQIDIAKYTKKYVDETGAQKAFIPDDTFIMFPSGTLGTGWFGTTPEQSDLMTGNTKASVTITDTGVAITTTKTEDPVTVETKASMIYLPSFEAADQVYILDVIK